MIMIKLGHKYYSNELTRALGVSFFVSILGVVFSILFDSWNDFLSAMNGNVNNAYTVSYFFMNSAYGGVCRSYFLPIFAAIPYAASFSDEQNSGAFSSIIFRKGKMRYAVCKFLVNALVGGIVVSSAIIILMILLSSVLPMGTELIADNSTDKSYMFHLWYAFNQPFTYALIEIANGFLIGMLWASCAIVVSTAIQNKLVIIVSPYLTSFILTHTLRLTRLRPDWRLDYWLTGRYLIKSSIYTLFLSTVAIFLICFVMGKLFVHKVYKIMRQE